MVFSREMKTGKNKVKHCIWNIVSDRIHIIIPNVTPFLCERIVKFIKISRLVELTRILWISWKQVKLWLKKKERKNAENLFAHGSKYSRSFASGSIRSDSKVSGKLVQTARKFDVLDTHRITAATGKTVTDIQE